VLYVLVTEIGLHRARVVALIGEGVGAEPVAGRPRPFL